MRTPLAALALMLPLALVACGGGGASGGGALPPAAAPSTATASATGRVVDAGSGAPLAGVAVALAPWTRGAAPIASATTAADGTFAVAAAPGRYLLVVGSDQPADARTTFHLGVTLASGANALVAPAPLPEPNVVYAAPQLSGAFRLATPAGDEASCVASANLGRANAGLRPFVADEMLYEETQAIRAEEFAQDTDTPSPLYPVPNGVGGTAQSIFGGTTTVHSEESFPTCGSWLGPAYAFQFGSPAYADVTNAANVWFAASFATKGASAISNPSYGAMAMAPDPRP